MKRVFFITQWYPSNENPVNGIFIREHARAISLENRVFVVHIRGVTPHLNAPYRVDQKNHGNFTEIKLEYARAAIPRTTWLRRLSAVNFVFQELSRNGDKPDLIHANVFNTADLAVLLSKRYHLPAVLTEHSSALPRQKLSRSQLVRMRILFNQLALIMPVSQDLGNRLREIGVNAPLMQIPNAVDTGIFYPGDLQRQGEPCCLISVARLDENKNTLDLITALAILKNDYGFSARLEIIGEGPLRADLETRISQNGLDQDVTLSGVLPKAAIAERLRQADIFLLPSRWENQPAAIIEALACGLPVIASRVGGIPEIVPPEFGRMLPPGSPDLLAAEIVDLWQNYHDIDRSSIVGYAKSRFGYEVIGRQFAQAYRMVLDSQNVKSYE